MKELIDEYIKMKQELETYREKNIQKNIEDKKKAFQQVLNSGIYDNYIKCNKIMKYVYASLKREKRKLFKSARTINHLEKIVDIYENGRNYATESTFDNYIKENNNEKNN